MADHTTSDIPEIRKALTGMQAHALYESSTEFADAVRVFDSQIQQGNLAAAQAKRMAGPIFNRRDIEAHLVISSAANL